MDLPTYANSEHALPTAELARRACIPHVAQINQWLNPRINRKPGEHYCVNLERASGGLMTCEELNPDLNWVRIPDPEWPWHPNGRPLINPDKTAPNTAQAA